MRVKGKGIWIALALAISVVLVFSCTKEKEPYKVGAVFSVTGRTSFLESLKKRQLR